MRRVIDMFEDVWDVAKDVSKLLLVVILGIVLLIGIIIGVLALVPTSKVSFEGEVQDKAFTGGQSSVVNTVNANGQVGVGVTSSDDEYYLFVEDTKVSVSKNTWLHYEKGDIVKVELHKKLGIVFSTTFTLIEKTKNN